MIFEGGKKRCAGNLFFWFNPPGAKTFLIFKNKNKKIGPGEYFFLIT